MLALGLLASACLSPHGRGGLLLAGADDPPGLAADPTHAVPSFESDDEARVSEALRHFEQARSEGRPAVAAESLAAARAAAQGLSDPSLSHAIALAEIRLALDLGRTDEATRQIDALVRVASSSTSDASGDGADDSWTLEDVSLAIALANARGRLAEATAPLAAAGAYAAGARRAEQADRPAAARRLWANAAHAAAAVGAPAAEVARFARQADELRLTEAGLPSDAAVELRLARAELIVLLRTPVRETEESNFTALRVDARRRVEVVLASGPEAGAVATRSLALGLRSALFAASGQYEPATVDAWAALRLAQSSGDVELEARWQAQLARLARRAGDPDRAIDHFEAAVTKAAALRPALARRTTIEPKGPLLDRIGEGLYLELVDLVLARAEQSVDPGRAQSDLRRAQAIVEAWKAAELRDYFRDDCVDAYREKLADPASVSATAAVVYPIALDDRLSLLVSHQGDVRQFVVRVGRATLDAEVRALRRWLEDRTLARYRTYARRLHDWLIAPIEAHLEALGIHTIVVVPGGSLRTIPFAALHDGERFLVERYAIATVPGLELTDPRPIDREGIEALLAGLSQARHGFSALAGVRQELETIHRRLGGTLLLDEDFERAAVREAFEHRRYNVVHMATHAQFGATPADSFLLAWDGPLTMEALGEAISTFRDRETPLDLLLLSACETAAGDERAALGLAGVAVRAGARSALATLWAVGDRAAQALVDHFYQALTETNRSRAEALRVAQRRLIEDPRLSHPANWAPFLMISSWL